MSINELLKAKSAPISPEYREKLTYGLVDRVVEKSIQQLQKEALIHMEQNNKILKTSNINLSSIPITMCSLAELKEADEETYYNHFSTTEDVNFLSLVDSIAQLGVIEPLVVLKEKDESLRILAGHRRKKACQLIVRELKDILPASTIASCKKLPCKIITQSIDLDVARMIVLHTNIARKLGDRELAKTIFYENKILEKHPNMSLKLCETLAETYHISKTKAYSLKSLGDQLLPDIFNYFVNVKDDVLNLNNVLKLTRLTLLEQEKLYNHYPAYLTNHFLKRIAIKNVTFNNLEKLFLSEDTNEEVVSLTFKNIPKVHNAEVKKVVESSLKLLKEQPSKLSLIPVPQELSEQVRLFVEEKMKEHSL